jgi:transcriptional regulator of acetoin/glycerol metabolism
MPTSRLPDGVQGSERKRERELSFGHSPTSALLPPDPAHVDAIRQSHERCAALGLSRIDSGDYSPLGRTDLVVARERNQRLCTHAVPVMDLLLEQILATKSMVVLIDAQGTLLHSVGDADFLERASKIALAPGVNWSEASKGTNGMGTALVTEQPIVVHADEHFMHANDFLTCSAAPIFDPRGNVLGVLDVTGDHRSYHTHTMGLVKMSARMIENHFFTDDFRRALRLHFHVRREFIDTLMEGIVAVDQDGRIVGANRSALDQLGLSAAAVRMNTVVSLFGVSLGSIVEHCRSATAAPMTLTLNNGLQLHVRMRLDWPVWLALGSGTGRSADAAADLAPVAESEPAPRRVERTAPAADGGAAASGLDYLRTGDPQMEAVVGKIRRALDRDISMLVLGETGTGKELLARAIHQDSARADKPFVVVNCASIPETLIEAELFGYDEGAFTGARRKGAMGRILQAHGGTLFLDEIGDMPLALQARLLRVLQERQVSPLGSSRSVAVDVSIISATHCNLREMVEQHAFREDLYYRLNGLSVKLPALRERTDLMTIAQKILRAECNGRPPALSEDVQRLIEHYHWPGNIRQLSNVLRAAAVMAGGERVITRAHLSDDFIEDVERTIARQSAQMAVPGVAPEAAAWLNAAAYARGVPAAQQQQQPQQPGPDATATLEELELQTIQRVVKELNGNISLASKRLGISRNTIYRKLRRS